MLTVLRSPDNPEFWPGSNPECCGGVQKSIASERALTGVRARVEARSRAMLLLWGLTPCSYPQTLGTKAAQIRALKPL